MLYILKKVIFILPPKKVFYFLILVFIMNHLGQKTLVGRVPQNTLCQLWQTLLVIISMWFFCPLGERWHIPAPLQLVGAITNAIKHLRITDSFILSGKKSWTWLNLIMYFAYILERFASMYTDLLSFRQAWHWHTLGLRHRKFHKGLSLQTSLSFIFKLSVYRLPKPIGRDSTQQLHPADPKMMG